MDKKSNIKIIKMEEGHIPEVAKLEAEVFSMPWSAQAFADALTMGHAIFYVAQAEHKVIGYCGLSFAADEGEITNVASAPGWRRKKIAKQLLYQTIAKAYEKGVRRVFLEVRSQNDPAIQLYEKTGFQTVGCRKNYYSNPQDDALLMMYEYADIKYITTFSTVD